MHYSTAIAKLDFNTVSYILRHPGLLHILRRWKGLRNTAYFKNAMHFYDHIAKDGKPSFFHPDQKDNVKKEFNKDRAIQDAFGMDQARKFFEEAAKYQMEQIVFNRRLRRLRLRRHS